MQGHSLAATRMVWLLYADLDTEQPNHLRSQTSAFDDVARSLVDAGSAILISSSAHTRELAFDDIGALLRGVLTLFRASKRACERSERHCIRMAVHAGIAHDRNGKLEGPSLTRAMRLRAIANDGQILFSGSAHDLTLGNLPAGIALRSLGSHRLKEIASPERVYQFVAPDLREEFPPLRTPSAVPNNLIVPTSRFVGRSAEIRRIADSLASERLVTLVGPGGVGKTRLATVIAANALSRFPDGVWMLELAPFHDISSVPSILAFHFGVRNIGDRPLIDAVVDTMRKKRALLVFDNCEHLVADLGSIIRTITANAPDIRILTTTRTVLGLDGEYVERIGSLALPPATNTPHSSLERFDSVALFVDRAKSVRSNLEITPDALKIIARICRRLDGIPLAIELAAARISAFELDEIESMLARRFELLVSDNTTITERQQTLKGLIDWSFALLSPEQRRVFTSLSIFVGTFALDDVYEICGKNTIDTEQTLSSLVDRSLVVAELDDDIAELRYHLLESTREYGLEHLKELGELDKLELRHARHYARVAGEHERHRPQTPLSAWLQRVERDYDNLAIAIARASDRAESETAAKIICRLREYWPYRRPDDCRRLLTTALKNTAHLDTATLGDLWLTDALLASRLRDDRKTLESSIIAIAFYESGKTHAFVCSNDDERDRPCRNGCACSRGHRV
ncbi:MAG: ATP-binding protein [Vulcanimicrobiaceae bacterium]